MFAKLKDRLANIAARKAAILVAMIAIPILLKMEK
jgi:hypothetical protein